MDYQAQVLIVEDEGDILSILAETIEDEGYTVLTATNAEQATSLLERGPVQVIFCDQNMGPGMTGLDFLEKVVLPLKFSMSFYLMTGESEHSDKSLQALGASGVVPKPFDVENVLEVIAKHL